MLTLRRNTLALLLAGALAAPVTMPQMCWAGLNEAHDKGAWVNGAIQKDTSTQDYVDLLSSLQNPGERPQVLQHMDKKKLQENQESAQLLYNTLMACANTPFGQPATLGDDNPNKCWHDHAKTQNPFNNPAHTELVTLDAWLNNPTLLTDPTKALQDALDEIVNTHSTTINKEVKNLQEGAEMALREKIKQAKPSVEEMMKNLQGFEEKLANLKQARTNAAESNKKGNNKQPKDSTQQQNTVEQALNAVLQHRIDSSLEQDMPALHTFSEHAVYLGKWCAQNITHSSSESIQKLSASLSAALNTWAKLFGNNAEENNWLENNFANILNDKNSSTCVFNAFIKNDREAQRNALSWLAVNNTKVDVKQVAKDALQALANKQGTINSKLLSAYIVEGEVTFENLLKDCIKIAVFFGTGDSHLWVHAMQFYSDKKYNIDNDNRSIDWKAVSTTADKSRLKEILKELGLTEDNQWYKAFMGADQDMNKNSAKDIQAEQEIARKVEVAQLLVELQKQSGLNKVAHQKSSLKGKSLEDYKALKQAIDDKINLLKGNENNNPTSAQPNDNLGPSQDADKETGKNTEKQTKRDAEIKELEAILGLVEGKIAKRQTEAEEKAAKKAAQAAKKATNDEVNNNEPPAENPDDVSANEQGKKTGKFRRAFSFKKKKKDTEKANHTGSNASTSGPHNQ